MEELTFGQKIGEWRKAAGLSQTALGIACGYKESSAMRTVQFWEHDTQLPSIMIARRLAEALKITLDELIP